MELIKEIDNFTKSTMISRFGNFNHPKLETIIFDGRLDLQGICICTIFNHKSRSNLGFLLFMIVDLTSQPTCFSLPATKKRRKNSVDATRSSRRLALDLAVLVNDFKPLETWDKPVESNMAGQPTHPLT